MYAVSSILARLFWIVVVAVVVLSHYHIASLTPIHIVTYSPSFSTLYSIAYHHA